MSRKIKGKGGEKHKLLQPATGREGTRAGRREEQQPAGLTERERESWPPLTPAHSLVPSLFLFPGAYLSRGYHFFPPPSPHMCSEECFQGSSGTTFSSDNYSS
ncbi:hypothetical protein NQZ68_025057 [Dissostichus eleginoides]|nr:hypothetical protein NQZ68_025057 [Dissostichus eleginoides]